MDQIIRAVRNLVDNENLSFKRIAEMHNISWETVQKIYNGETSDLSEDLTEILKRYLSIPIK
ncbi:MAG: hypothetical protein H8D23_08125 [Candidatus Brocadiales bacterium]|nr:hypothetical protein [Candidatus Brocadiales bacterium]